MLLKVVKTPKKVGKTVGNKKKVEDIVIRSYLMFSTNWKLFKIAQIKPKLRI